MNTIGITDNLDRARIGKLLTIGLAASALTGAGDFLLGYAIPAGVVGGPVDGMLATAPNLSDAALVAGGLLGFVGLFLEGLAYFAIWRLMADAAPRYAHILRSGIFGYIWLAPVACHMNMGVFYMAYKYLWQVDPQMAHDVMARMYPAFGLPAYALLVVFWLPMIVVQWRAFAQGLTPYPTHAKWFCVLVGAVPALVISALVGAESALGGGIGTMFLSFGNAWVFGGLLATLPSQERFDEFRAALETGAEQG